jgi:hypothetical protein
LIFLAKRSVKSSNVVHNYSSLNLENYPFKNAKIGFEEVR